MGTPSTDTVLWVAQALRGSEVWNIGQLDAATVRELDRFVRKGRLAKSRRIWCNISGLKTVWHLPVAS